MTLRNRRAAREVREAFLASLRAQVGYRARPNLDTVYGVTTGHPNQPWAGALLQHCATEARLDLPALNLTTSALQHFTRTDRLYRNPRPGDIVFYGFPAEGQPYGQPHTGVVTETGTWKLGRSFLAIEGQVSPGPASPRSDPAPTGVFERERFETDVLAFARPRFAARQAASPAENAASPIFHVPWIRTGHFKYGKAHKSVELVQQALGETVGLRNSRRGYFDSQTKSAYAAYQRSKGLTDATGQPDSTTLEQLGTITGIFTVRP